MLFRSPVFAVLVALGAILISSGPVLAADVKADNAAGKSVPPTTTSGAAVAPATGPASSAPAAKADGGVQAPPAVQHSRLLPVKIHPVQEGADNMSKAAPNIQTTQVVDPDTIGLYDNPAKGSLGENLWAGMTGDAIASGFRDIPAPQDPVTRSLIVRALLTKSLPAQKASKAGNDLYSVRLQSLVGMGALREAVDLYKLNESAPPTPLAALSGVEAIVGSNQLGLACLEQKAIDPALQVENKEFWSDLGMLCQALLSPAAGDDDSLRLANASRLFVDSLKLPSGLAVDDLNKLNAVRLVAYYNGRGLGADRYSAAQLHALSDKSLSILYAASQVNREQHLSLAAESAHRGIVSSDDLLALYADLSKSPKDKKTPVITDKWTDFLNLYVRLSGATKPDDRALILTQMIAKAEPLGVGAITPFLSEIKNLPPGSLDSKIAKLIVAQVLQSGQRPSEKLIRLAFGTDTTALVPTVLIPSSVTTLASEKSPVDKKDAAATKKPEAATEISLEAAYSMALKDTLELADSDHSDNKYIYDNILNLTAKGNYVMPSVEFMRNLQKAAKEQQAGKVVLDGLKVLSGRETGVLHPAALYSVLRAFKSVGLSEETVSIAYQSLSGISGETKEK